MAQTSPQNLANHVRRDPLFHYFLLPIYGISLLVSLGLLVRSPGFRSFFILLFVTAVVVTGFKARLYALKVQDRVIRLEERLRLATLLPDSLRPRIPSLSESQLIALRFASDEEIPALVERTLSSNLPAADIKKAIKSWRPDYWRV